MLEATLLEQAVDLQERSYRLLRWLGEAMAKGFIAVDTAHDYVSFPDAAAGWIREHLRNLPPAARPPEGLLTPFCRLFTSYLESSFDFVRAPGQRLYSQDAHCFCPMCSVLVAAPHLRAKRLRPTDRARARRMQLTFAAALARTQSVAVTDAALASLLADPATAEALALATWGAELIRRMEGAPAGPAALALWRAFAWNRTGSPKKDLRITAAGILDAERTVAAAVAALGATGAAP